MLACLRPGLIDGTHRSVEENASAFGPAQNRSLFFRLFCIVAKELLRFHAKEARQALDIALIQLSGGDTTAIRAGGAVDLFFRFLCDCLEPPLDKIVPFQPGTETQILIALSFSHSPDLHKVRYHAFSIAVKQKVNGMFAIGRVDNQSVSDQLYLSIWLPGTLSNWRTRYFEKMLSLVPFSQREQPQSTLTIQGVSVTEPPLLEKPINGPIELSEVSEALRDYQGDDVAYRLESWWDLWQYSGEDWEIKPVRVALFCFGGEFDNGRSLSISQQEDLRIDFGVDTLFLPDPSLTGSGRLVESNVKSLLKLVHDVEDELPLERRALETESGENFAEKLARLMGGETRPQ